jgi:hypothetical protein
MSKVSNDGESYYGLGDKPNHLNLKGKRYDNWVTDSYAYGKDTDPIYKAIPFYTGFIMVKPMVFSLIIRLGVHSILHKSAAMSRVFGHREVR